MARELRVKWICDWCHASERGYGSDILPWNWKNVVLPGVEFRPERLLCDPCRRVFELALPEFKRTVEYFWLGKLRSRPQHEDTKWEDTPQAEAPKEEAPKFELTDEERDMIQQVIDDTRWFSARKVFQGLLDRLEGEAKRSPCGVDGCRNESICHHIDGKISIMLCVEHLRMYD